MAIESCMGGIGNGDEGLPFGVAAGNQLHRTQGIARRDLNRPFTAQRENEGLELASETLMIIVDRGIPASLLLLELLLRLTLLRILK